jgi:hypothetical protein
MSGPDGQEEFEKDLSTVEKVQHAAWNALKPLLLPAVSSSGLKVRGITFCTISHFRENGDRDKI